MTAGFPATKAVVDGRIGQLAVTLRDTMDDVLLVKAWLDSQADAQLTALGYDTGDVTLIRNSYTDLANLVATARGTRAQAAANDFFFNAKKLTALS